MSEPILDITGLSISYSSGPARRNAVVHGVSLAVPARGVVALVGESGSGKSTLAHSVARLLPPNARIDAGSIVLGGTDLTRTRESRMRAVRGKRIGFVPQDPMMSLNPTHRIGTQIAEAIRLHERCGNAEVSGRVRRLLLDAGFDAGNVDRAAAAFPHELSGGMLQRVLIAMACACGPELIIADEPTSALDVTVARRVLDHLQALVERNGCSLLIITHDLALAARRSDRVAVMTRGRIVECGPSDEVLGSPTHPYTRGLVASMPRARATGTVAGAPPPDAPALLVVDRVTKTFDVPGRGELTAVDDISFAIPTGGTFALVGESGSGKSTTARMALGLEEPTSGSITFEGQDIATLTRAGRRGLRRQTQVVYQNPYRSLDPRFTVEATIAEPLRAFGIGSRREQRARVRDLLDRVGLPGQLARRRPRELSGGQRQRVAIARAIAISPQLVVCDEPVSALDASVQLQVLDLLTEIQRDLGVSYLFISHDLAVVRTIAHTVGVMRAGRLLEAGPVEQIFRAPAHEYTRELIEASAAGAPVAT
jgi:peptide/nickel transport system ATP-binding protein